MATISVQCNCGKSYDVPADKAGKRFKCVACGESLAIPAAEPVAKVETAAKPAESARPARAEGSKSASRRTPREPAAKKSSMPLILGGVGLVAVIGIVAFMMMKGGGDSKTNNANNTTVAKNEPVKPEPPKDPKELKKAEYTKRLAEAEKDPNPIPRFLEIATFCLADPKFEAEAKQIYEKVVTKDPENTVAREALGFKKYDGDQTEHKGKWVTADQFVSLTATDTASREEEAKKKAEEEARAKDPFIRRAKERIAEMQNMIDDVNAIGKDEAGKLAADYKESDDIDKYKKSDATPAEFDFYYATAKVPKPYLLAIQKGGMKETDSLAWDFGEMFSELHRAFYRRYEGYVKLRDLNETPVPVWIFHSAKQYERWRRCGNRDKPRTGGVRAFYSGTQKNNSSGMLYLWLINTLEEKGSNVDQILEIQDTAWHEGTHQLMDFNSPQRGFKAFGNMPWTQEGFAEYVGTHRRVSDKSQPNGWRYFFGLPNVGRRQELFSYGPFSNRQERDEFIEASPSLREVCHTDYLAFWNARSMAEAQATGEEAAKAKRLVSGTYSYGWVLCHFLQHQVDENGKLKYRDQFHEWLSAELETRASGELFDKLFKLDTDEKWREFELEFQNYITLDLRRDTNDAADLKDRVFEKYSKLFEEAIKKKN
ncbi:MAG: hypothetical protein ACKVS6_05175 [Planctomycetota bacterium]